MSLDRFYPIFDSTDWLRRLLPLGIKLVQLRIKDVDEETVRQEVRLARDLCRDADCTLVVNDYWRIAIDEGCDWVHLGQEDLNDADMSAIRNAGIKLGLSTHDRAELDRAMVLNPDYVALGPVYPTILKKMKWHEQGVEKLSEWKNLVGDTPLVAIGGMSIDRADGAFEAGADVVSAVTDITLNADPEARVRDWDKSHAMTRYTRQQILPEIGADGQAAFVAARVLVVGAGGLGCPVLQYLVGAGVGSVTVVDGDVVSLSNLHRQTLFRENEVGDGKAKTAVETLAALNGNTSLSAIQAPLTPANVEALINGMSVVLDCADSFSVSYILSDACSAAGIPMISASALGLSGYVGGFCGGAPSLRTVFPELPMHAATCATAGVMGPVVGIIGAMQAQMALAVLIGLEPTPLGQLVTIDMSNYSTGGFRFDDAKEPKNSLKFIAAQDITSNDFVVELRREASTPVTPNARRHDVVDFSTICPIPPTGKRAVLTCRSGLRAWQAARKLQSYWNGEISLIAMGDTPELERPKT